MILDTRTKKEYDTSHMPNAVFVDFDKAMKSKDLISTIQTNITQQRQLKNNNNNENKEDENKNENNNDSNNEIDLLNTNVYCYCSVGWRSSIMVEKITDAIVEQNENRNANDSGNDNTKNEDKITKENVSNIKNVQGSIFEWVNQGYPVVNDDNQNVDKVHTYNKVWGLLVDDTSKRVC